MTAISSNLISMLAQQLAAKPSQGGPAGSPFNADGLTDQGLGQDFLALMNQQDPLAMPMNMDSQAAFTETEGQIVEGQAAESLAVEGQIVQNLIDSNEAQTRWMMESQHQVNQLQLSSRFIPTGEGRVSDDNELLQQDLDVIDLSNIIDGDYSLEASRELQSIVDAIDLNSFFSADQLGIESVATPVFTTGTNETVAVLLVELSSLATGKLSQFATINQQLLAAIESQVQLMQAANNKNSMGDIKSLSIVNVDQSSSSTKLVNQLQSLSLANQTNNSLSKDAVKNVEQSSAKSMIQSLFSKEYQSKNISFIYNEDGVKVWYRDYASDANKAEQQLAELKSYLENFITIKSMGLNGKVVYQNFNQEGGF